MYQQDDRQQEYAKRKLKECAQTGNLHELEWSWQLIQSSGITANAPLDEHSNTGLHLAAEAGQLEVAKFLEGKSADIASVNSFGQTAEKIAASKGHAGLANWLKQLRKGKERGAYADKNTVEELQAALPQLQLENKSLRQKGLQLAAEIEKLKTQIAELNEKATGQEKTIVAQQSEISALKKSQAEEISKVQEGLKSADYRPSFKQLEDRLAAQEKLDMQKKLSEQEKTIAAQQNEINSLTKSQKEMKGKQAFFTPEIQKMLLSKQAKLREKEAKKLEEAKRRKEERKYQELREKQRQEKQRQERLLKQGRLIKALLRGDLEEAKKQEGRGALLTEPDENGTYPLVAAVYGLNLEAVNYIEGRLKEQDATLQWSKMDIQKLSDEIEKSMPPELPSYGGYGEYEEYADLLKVYDEKPNSRGINEKLRDFGNTVRELVILERTRDELEAECSRLKKVYEEMCNYGLARTMPWDAVTLHPQLDQQREEVVRARDRVENAKGSVRHCKERLDFECEQIREQLKSFRKMVEAKAGKQPGAVAKFNV